MVREGGRTWSRLVTSSGGTAQLRAAVNTFIPALDKSAPQSLSTPTPQDGRSGERGQKAAEPGIRSELHVLLWKTRRGLPPEGWSHLAHVKGVV